MMMMHMEMDVHPLAFLTSPLAGGLVSLIMCWRKPPFPTVERLDRLQSQSGCHC